MSLLFSYENFNLDKSSFFIRLTKPSESKRIKKNIFILLLSLIQKI